MRAIIPGYDFQDAWKRCHILVQNGLYCGVELLPNGLKLSQAGEGVISR